MTGAGLESLDAPSCIADYSEDHMRPIVRFLLIAIACLAIPAGAQAATPFTAGSGASPDVAVGSDGTGHVVWQTGGENDQVGYCRVSAEATACNRTELLSFPGYRSPGGRRRARLHSRAGKGRDRRRMLGLPDRDQRPDLSLDLDQQRDQLQRRGGNRDRPGNERQPAPGSRARKSLSAPPPRT